MDLTPFTAVLLFACIWIVMTYVISMFGWRKLAERFRDGVMIPVSGGKKFAFQSARIGKTRYNNALFIRVNHSGIRLAMFPVFRFFHPPVMIPWHSVAKVEGDIITIGNPEIIKLRLTRKVIQEINKIRFTR